MLVAMLALVMRLLIMPLSVAKLMTYNNCNADVYDFMECAADGVAGGVAGGAAGGAASGVAGGAAGGAVAGGAASGAAGKIMALPMELQLFC